MEQSVAKEVFEMRTPEEIRVIKLALTDIETTCGHCPYEGEPNGCNRPGGTCKMFDVALDAAEAIQQLEEKTLPKKCTHEATLHRDLTCPVCKNVVSHTVEIFGNKLEAITDYCPYCGQRIESDEAENEVE